MKFIRTVVLLSFVGFILPNAHAGVVAMLHSFNGADGLNPECTLAVGGDGNLYGSTYSATINGGYGTVFRLTTSGVFSNLYYFDNTNGANPSGQLALGLDGNVYGTTGSGGPTGLGTVFKVTTNGAVTRVASVTNGSNPAGGLFCDSDGAMYGANIGGGIAGLGSVFKFTPDNTSYNTLISFDSINGGGAEGPPVRDTNSQNFYGATGGYGLYGRGTIYRVVPNGAFTTLTNIFAFNGTNGGAAYGALVQALDGNFYGTTFNGGTNGGGFGNGTIFSISTLGVFKNLVYFNGTNGAHPFTGLTLGPDGTMYGVTRDGGSNGANAGTLFQITTNGTFTSLVSFIGAVSTGPYGGLTLGPDGNLYGSTQAGGNSGGGSLFRYIFNPAPPVIQSVTKSNLTATLTWSSLLGCKYQLQYKTNLLQPAWLNIGGSVLASGASTVVPDNNAVDQRRFYRVELLVN